MADKRAPPLSFAPPPLGGPPPGAATSLSDRITQDEPRLFGSDLSEGPSTEFLARLRGEIQANPFGLTAEETRSFTQVEIQLKVQRLEAEAEARASAKAKSRKAVQEDIRGAEIGRLMARARQRHVPGGFLPVAERGLVSEAREAVDAGQELGKRLESVSMLGRAELSAGLPGAPMGLADPFRREVEEQLLTEARKAAVDPERVSLSKAKDLLVGLRLVEEQERARGGAESVFDAKGIAKDFRAFLDKADEGGVRERLKIEIRRAIEKRETIPSEISDALSVTPLGSRKAGLFGRGFADGITLGVSENIRVGVFGQRGLAEEIAGGNEGEWVPHLLGFMAGAMTNFVALDLALVKSGVRTFSGRPFIERLAVESAMQDVVRIPSIVLNGRIRGFSDETIVKQVGVELGIGFLAGATLGLAGMATSFGVRKGLAGGIVLSREFGRNVASIGRGLGRIAREAPEKFPQILDLAKSFEGILVTSVGGVTGDAPRRLVRSKSELLKIAKAVIDQRGLSAGEVAKVVRRVAPKRGASGKLEGLSTLEIGEVGRELLKPQPSVPRGTKLNDEDHLFFAVPLEEADALRRSGVVPPGTQFHSLPRAAASGIKGPAEVFAIPASQVGASATGFPGGTIRAATMAELELPTAAAGGLPRRVIRLEEPNVQTQLPSQKPQGLFTQPGEQSGKLTAGKINEGIFTGQETVFEVNPDIKVLHVDATELFVTNRGLVGQSPNIVAARQFFGDDTVTRFMRMRVTELRRELSGRYPGTDFKGIDQTELVEQAAGVEARRRGFDAIFGVDKSDSGFDEFVALTDKVLLPVTRQPGMSLPTLSKTAQGGAKESLSAQLRGFSDHEAFGLDPVETLLANPPAGAVRSLPDELGRFGKLRRRRLPSEVLQAHAYKEAYWGISRNVIEAWAPEHGRRYAGMVDQVEELAAAGRAEFQFRYEEMVRSLSAKEINQMELAFAGRKPLGPNAHPRVKRALRERIQYDSDKMDKIEAPLSDGSFMLKMDGTPFKRLEGGHIAQPWGLDLVEAVEAGSQTRMKLHKASGKFRMWDPETKKFISPSVTGRQLKQQLGRFKLYNELIEMAARQMDEKGMRYITGTHEYRTGVGTKMSREKLKMQARHFFKDHRDVLAAQQFSRIKTPSSRDITEGAGPRPMGAIQFNRFFEYDVKFIRPNLGDNEMRHVGALFGRRAEVEVFGPKLERMTEVFRAVQEEIKKRGLGPKKVAEALEYMQKLYARETGNLAVDESINSLATFAGQEATSQWIRNLAAGMFLGPGSRFQLGGNAIWAVMGAAFQVPVKNVVKEFGWATLASSSLGGTGGAFAGNLLGDTPEEKARLGALLGVIGTGIGFGATLPIDSTARALTPAAIPIAAALSGALLPDSEDSAIVERSLLAAGGWLGGTSIARGRLIRRLASSSTAVRAARSAGALSVGGLTQADLATNALSPAFRGERGPLGEYVKDLLFGVIQATEVWARSSSAKAQLAAATEIIDNFAKDPKLRDTRAGKAFSRQLERLGLSRETVNNVIERNEGILPDALVDRIMRKGVNNTQYSLRPLDLPLKWSSPWGKIYTQFMGMHLRQFENGLRFSLQEAGLGSWMPLFKVVSFSLTAGWTLAELGSFISGNDLLPRARNKFTRFMQILGPAIGEFETPLRVAARIGEGASAGRVVVEALTPPSVSAAEQIVDALFDSAREVMNDGPGIKRGRGRVGNAIRRFPPVNAIGNVARRVAPTDEQRFEEFAKQMPLRLQEIEAAKQGVSLVDYLKSLPRPDAGSPFAVTPFPEARRLAERAAPAVEGAMRAVASGVGFLGVAPSMEAAEAKADAVRSRLKLAPGVLKRRAEFLNRIAREGAKPQTKETVLKGVEARAMSKARGPTIEAFVTAVKDDNKISQRKSIKLLAESGMKPGRLASLLRARAKSSGDESLTTSVSEYKIHRLFLIANKVSARDAGVELRKGRPNPARFRALVDHRNAEP